MGAEAFTPGSGTLASAPTAPLQRGTLTRASSPLATRAYQRVREAILRGDLRPNQRLIEAELAQWLEVSRTPLREGLTQLRMEGLITGGRRGWIVRDFSAREVREIHEVRAALEGMAAYLVAERASNEVIEGLVRLQESHDPMALAESRDDAFVDYNELFHEAVLEAAGSQRLADFTRLNRDFFFNYRIARLFSPEEARKTELGHDRVIDAIRNRDGERAAIEMRDHILEARDVIIGKLY